MNRLAAAAWPEIKDRPLVLVPLGSLEQHGPHLPLDTDAVIAEAVAARAAELLGDAPVVVAPVLAYGASGEHQMFPGTSSIGTAALRLLLIELVRSISTWSGRIILVNAHGGNHAALSGAVAQLLDEGHDLAWAPCTVDDSDAHAGYTETSLMLHLRPSARYLDRAEPGDTTPLGQLWPTLSRDGVGAVSPNGVLGDPTGASTSHGARCLEAMAGDLAGRIRAGRADSRGMLCRTSGVAP